MPASCAASATIGSRAGAGAAAHTGGEEYHIGTLERLGDGVAALLGGALADIGVGARALAVRQLFADLDGLLRARKRREPVYRY